MIDSSGDETSGDRQVPCQAGVGSVAQVERACAAATVNHREATTARHASQKLDVAAVGVNGRGRVVRRVDDPRYA